MQRNGLFYFSALLFNLCLIGNQGEEGGGGGLRRSHQKQKQFCEWQGTWRSDTTNAGIKFT